MESLPTEIANKIYGHLDSKSRQKLGSSSRRQHMLFDDYLKSVYGKTTHARADNEALRKLKNLNAMQKSEVFRHMTGTGRTKRNLELIKALHREEMMDEKTMRAFFRMNYIIGAAQHHYSSPFEKEEEDITSYIETGKFERDVKRIQASVEELNGKGINLPDYAKELRSIIGSMVYDYPKNRLWLLWRRLYMVLAEAFDYPRLSYKQIIETVDEELWHEEGDYEIDMD